MGLIHIPRTIAASIRGVIKRRLSSPLADQDIGISKPYIYSSRAGIFDVDIMGHMNNAAYLQHAEYARWEWSAFGGSLARAFQTNSFFIVTASITRYRREIAPLKRFDIETRLVGLDDRNLWVYQTFHYPINGDKKEEGEIPMRGKILAQILTKGAFAKPGKGVINPRNWLEENSIYNSNALDEVMNQTGETVKSTLFDEKAKRFVHLEDVLKRSAASYDDKVPK